MWFQQDGATCHPTCLTMDLLRGEFGEHFISRPEPVNWPPISCDLKSLDYLLWVFVKANVCTDRPASIDILEDNIEAFLREITTEMLLPKLNHLRSSQHLLEIIFKH